MPLHENFRIDENGSGERYLYVDVIGYGTVSIKRDDEGIVVDIFRCLPTDDPDQDCVASTWAHINDLNPGR